MRFRSMALTMLLAACSGPPAPTAPEQPAPIAPQPVSEQPPASPAEPTMTAENVVAGPEPEVTEEVIVGNMRFIVQGRAVAVDDAYRLVMVVTANTAPDDEAWLFGVRSGLSLKGRLQTGIGTGGGFGEGGSFGSKHVVGAQPTEMKRVYPRNDDEEPIGAGTRVAVDVNTNICRTPKQGEDCSAFKIATVILSVPMSGTPTVKVEPGKAE